MGDRFGFDIWGGGSVSFFDRVGVCIGMGMGMGDGESRGGWK